MKSKVGKMLTVALILAIVLGGCGGSSGAPASSVGSETSASSSPASAPMSAVRPTHTAKFGHVMAPDSPSGLGAVKFAELVAQKTNGEIIVEVFHNSQLGGDRDMVEAQQIGSLDFCLPGCSVYVSFEPTVGVCSLPFLYESAEQAHKFLDGPVATEIFSVTKNQNITVLTTFESGFRQLGTRTPVNSLADLKGMKIRVPQGELFLNVWKALGTSPTALSWNEIFSALQTGVIDGEEAPLANFATMGFGEVAPYFAFINYTYDPLLFTVSNTFWHKLTDSQRAAILAAAQEARDFQRVENARQEKMLEEKLTKEQNMVFVRPDLEPFREAVQPVYINFAYPDLLKKVRDAIAK